jgi:hypothetical protein
MPCTFICIHCGNSLPGNTRLKKKQKYCDNKQCQRARMRTWKKKQYNKNITYRKKCLEGQRLWRKDYPSNQYQREYRKEHPGYLNRNRELQRDRNKKRKKEPVSMIVKTDALLFQPREDGAYMLSKVKKEMIVNRNTLSPQSSIDGIYTLFKMKEKKIVNRNALIAGSQ